MSLGIMRSVSLASFVLWILAASQVSGVPDPFDVALRATNKVLSVISQPSYINFGTWSYEGGNIVRGLWENQAAFPELDLEPFLHSHLNHFQTDPSEYGYKILHNVSLDLNGTSTFVPWFFSVGDVIGLFPVGYADRLRYAINHSAFSQHDDLYIVSETVEKYIYGYPHHLEDGTISRLISWLDEGFIDLANPVTLWVDDMFMGTTLTTELSLLTGEPSHVQESARQLIAFAGYLVDSSANDALYHHGYHHTDEAKSCCKWGRGNGWSLMAKADCLKAYHELGLNETDADTYGQLLALFQDHSSGLKSVQSNQGLWHNILTNNSTFLETSASGMYLKAFVDGVLNGWLDSQEYSNSIDVAWSALADTVQQDGAIEGIIKGTGIKNSEDGYDTTENSYNRAGPGVGGVLRAIAAAGRYYSMSHE